MGFNRPYLVQNGNRSWATPVLLQLPQPVAQIACGAEHTIALLSNGHVSTQPVTSLFERSSSSRGLCAPMTRFAFLSPLSTSRFLS